MLIVNEFLQPLSEADTWEGPEGVRLKGFTVFARGLCYIKHVKLK